MTACTEHSACILAPAKSWRLTGDQYVEKGGKPWISEMYGYAFGAAKANVWHKWDKKTMMYPTYRPTGERVLRLLNCSKTVASHAHSHETSWRKRNRIWLILQTHSALAR